MKDSELEKQIIKIIHELSDKKGAICSVDILIQLDYLSQVDYVNWRNGKVEYLEKVCKVNLSKLGTINQIMKHNAVKMNLKPSWTGYNKYGKGAKRKLRFSKSGNEIIEKAYATHWINEFQIKKLREQENQTNIDPATSS